MLSVMVRLIRRGSNPVYKEIVDCMYRQTYHKIINQISGPAEDRLRLMTGPIRIQLAVIRGYIFHAIRIK